MKVRSPPRFPALSRQRKGRLWKNPFALGLSKGITSNIKGFDRLNPNGFD